MTTLWDFLFENIPGTLLPTPASRTIATSTRDISPEEAKTDKAERLHAIVYDHDLLGPLIAAGGKAAKGVLLENLEKDPLFHRWEAHVYHASSSFMLPPYVNSEMDATSWFNEVLGRPALAAVNLVQDINLEHGVASALTATKFTAGDKVPPFLISAQREKNKPVPDGLLMNGGPSDPEVTPVLLANAPPQGILELKSPNALKSAFKDVTQARLDKNMRPIAIPFLYPHSDNIRTKTKLAKMIIQLYSQMNKHKCRYGLLSSYHETIFAYSKSELFIQQNRAIRINILYLSRMYRIGSTSLAPFFSWFLHIFKTPEEDLRVPKANLELAVKFMSEKEIKKLETMNEVTGKSDFDCGPQTEYTDEYFNL